MKLRIKNKRITSSIWLNQVCKNWVRKPKNVSKNQLHGPWSNVQSFKLILLKTFKIVVSIQMLKWKFCKKYFVNLLKEFIVVVNCKFL